MRRLFTFFIGALLICSLSVSATLTRDDFIRITFDNNLGSVTNNMHVTINVQKGWNVLPLGFIADAKSRYWGNYKEGQTCDMAVFDNVWMYSPVAKNYYHIPVMDDWVYPKSRENNFLLNEFRNKYYHVYSGGAWLYSSENCILEGDNGIELTTGGLYDNSMEDKRYKYDELVLKAGWNFVPIQMAMVAYEKPLKDIFEGCGVERYNIWDNRDQKWLLNSQEMGQLLGFDQKVEPAVIFKTLVVKTSRDCYLGTNMFSQTSSSTPPAIPN